MCGKDKPLSEFHLRQLPKSQDQKLRTGGSLRRRNECKSCYRNRQAEHYKKNKGAYIESNRKRRNNIRAVLNSLKENKPCADCRGTFLPCQMDWDHVDPSTKIGGVSNLASRHYLNRTLEEIAKCELVCANCHRLRTWKRRQLGSGTPDSNGRPPRPRRGALPG